MKKSLFLAGSVTVALVFSGIAYSENEATYNLDTRALHIPKVAVGTNYYDADFQQGEDLNFLLTATVPSVSGSSANIAVYNPNTHLLSIPVVAVGADSYIVDMQQGQGSNFAVTNALLVNPYFESIDVFDLNSHHSGGSRSSSINTSTGGGHGCEYGHIRSRAESDQLMQQFGGSVTLSTLTEWCGTAAGESACIKGFDRLMIDDELRRSQARVITLHMTELLPNHWTEVEFDSLAFNPYGNNRPSTNVSAVSSDTSVGEGAECDISAHPIQSREFIDGMWVGYKATYSPDTMTGFTSTATLSCASQACTINSSSGVTSVNLSSFSSVFNGGAWATASGAPQLAGASMTGDRQLLSMFVCNAPLDEARAFDNCSFFTFKR